MPALFRKYRPQRFSEVAEQEHVVKTLTQQIIQGSLAQVYLFSGPRGVGKTTIARLLAKSLQCTGREASSAESCGACPSCSYAAEGKMLDTIEIDAASQTGVDAVRENIIEGVRFGPSLGKYKVFIIDEVHMLSTASFNALLKTLEEPPKYAIFILATTELHKIPATVLSRCQRFAFTRIPVPAMVERLRTIAQAEGRTVEDDVLYRIARLSEGCLRDAESLLGQVCDSVEGVVSLATATAVLPDSSLSLLNTLIHLLATGDVAEAAREVRRASERGTSLRHVHDDFLEYVQAVVFASWGDDPKNTYDEATANAIRHAATHIGAQSAVALLDELLAARLRQAPALLPELPLQVAFFKWGGREGSIRGNVGISRGSVGIEGSEGNEGGKGSEDLSSEQKLPPRNDTNVPTHSSLPVPSPSPHPTPHTPHATQHTPHPTPSSYTSSIHEKWNRCLEKAKETGAGYALMVGAAQFVGIENEHTIVVAFPYQMHVDHMQEPKNAKILLDAMKEVCLLPPEMTLKAVRTKRPEDDNTEVSDLLAAFGGSVV